MTTYEISTTTEDRKVLIEEFCNNVKSSTKADHVHIRTIDWLKRELLLNGVSPNEIESEYPEYCSISCNDAIGGFVFLKRHPRIVFDIKKDENFCKYAETQSSKKYRDFLSTFKSGIVVPIFLQDKVIGVLTAIWTESSMNLSTSQNNQEQLVRFASQVPSALHIDWLWEAITWKPGEADVTVDNFSSAMEREVKLKTGADSAQVRLLNWEEKFSVPTSSGVDHLLSILTVCELCHIDSRTCPECEVTRANDSQSLLVKDLDTDEKYALYKDMAETKSMFLFKLLETLNQCKEKIANENGGNYEHIRDFFRKKYDECIKIWDKDKNITKRRFELPETINKKKITEFLTRQLRVLEDLSKAWSSYVEELNKWKSELVVRIHHGDRLLGVLSAFSVEKDWFSKADITILTALANQFSCLILERQQTLVAELLNIGHEMTSRHNFEKLREKLLYIKISEEAAYFQKQEEGDMNFILFVCKPPTNGKSLINQSRFLDYFEYQAREGAKELEIDLGKEKIRPNGLGYKAIKKLDGSSPVFIVCDNVVDPIRDGSEMAYNAGIQSTVCIPLASDGIVYGLLYIHSKRMRFFTKIERDTFLLFAQQATTLLKITTSDSDALYDSTLIDMASKSTEESLPGYFKDYCRILQKYNLKRCTIAMAGGDVKEIVYDLIKVAELPSEIGERYVDFCAEEALLYHDQKYRDHFFHPFHTFLLGFEVLKKLKEAKQSGKIEPDTPMPFYIEDGTFLRKWLLTSLWHDIAYAAEKGSSWLSGYISKILDIDIKYDSNWGELLVKEENLSLINDMIREIDSVVKDKSEIFQAWFYNQLVTYGDHAILSAFLLKKEYKKDDWNEITDSEIDECAVSIALHNLPKTFSDNNKDDSFAKRIGALDIEKFPLAYLLSYCDTAQEWGRFSHNDKDPTEFTEFMGVGISGEKKIIAIKLDKKVEEYIRSFSETQTNTNIEASDKITEMWKNEIEALKRCWSPSNWSFLIELFATSFSEGGCQPIRCHKEP